ncbi:hypothetical protein [Leptospira noguchii]|uniref:hypothetical protein n=1 Tax=Leptospira noguchii TaxID=28182 RepID=UPI001FB72228|nr:hypothetical protein [Leptospira noguchii]UOG48420.1 hypothetical protein MAL00_15750 [Leptospira noguchii]
MSYPHPKRWKLSTQRFPELSVSLLETQQNTPYGSCFRSLDRSRCGIKFLVFYEN